MFRQSKATQQAIAALSRLAEVYHQPGVFLSASEVARDRNLAVSVASKTLSLLAQAKLVTGAPGPGGGYRLARPPSELSLFDVVSRFEPPSQLACPYGPGYCGNNPSCPLHDSLSAFKRLSEDYLRNTRFDIFAARGGAMR